MRVQSLTIMLMVAVAGCTDPETERDTVQPATNQPPVARLNATPALLSEGQTVRLDGGASHDPDGRILGYRWDFGDGSPGVEGAQSAVTHAFPQAGTYRVTLTVTDNGEPAAQKSVSLALGVALPPLLQDIRGSVAAPTLEGEASQPVFIFFFVKPGADLLRWELNVTPNAGEWAQVSARLVNAGGDVAWIKFLDVPPEGAIMNGSLTAADLQGAGAWRFEMLAALGGAAFDGHLYLTYAPPT